MGRLSSKLSFSMDFGAGQGAVVASFQGGKSVIERARAESPLRLLLPKAMGATAAWVCVTSFGGGLVRGDELTLDVDVKPDATLLMTTQASTKAFRGGTKQMVRARVEGTLVALPDPVACFAGATYESEIAVTLGATGTIVLVDSFTSGRPAYGERWAFEQLSTRIRIERLRSDGGREPVALDATLLDARHGSIAARFGNLDAYATLMAIGPAAGRVMASLLEPSRDGVVLYAPSRLTRADGAVARVAGGSSEDVLREVRRRLRHIVELCGVDPYASRH